MRDHIYGMGRIEIFRLNNNNRKVEMISDGENLIVNAGLDALSKAIVSQHAVYAGGADLQPRYCAFGTGVTAVVAGNTGLEIPYNPADTSPTASTSFLQFTSITHQATGVTKLITLYDKDNDANGEAGGFKEAGIFTGPVLAGDPPVISGLTLVSRVILGATVFKTSAASLQVEWTYTLSNP